MIYLIALMEKKKQKFFSVPVSKMSTYEILQAGLSGVSLVGIEQVVSRGEGKLLSVKNIKKAGVQGLSSYVVSNRPNGFSYTVFPAHTQDSLMTGALYTISTQVLKVDSNSLIKRFLVFTGADYLARQSVDTVYSYLG